MGYTLKRTWPASRDHPALWSVIQLPAQRCGQSVGCRCPNEPWFWVYEIMQEIVTVTILQIVLCPFTHADNVCLVASFECKGYEHPRQASTCQFGVPVRRWEDRARHNRRCQGRAFCLINVPLQRCCSARDYPAALPGSRCRQRRIHWG